MVRARLMLALDGDLPVRFGMPPLLLPAIGD